MKTLDFSYLLLEFKLLEETAIRINSNFSSALYLNIEHFASSF